MSRYDGPSIFRKNDSKISRIKDKKKNYQRAERTKQVNTQFKNTHENKLPGNIRTRSDLQKEAERHMRTSPAQSNKQNNIKRKAFKRKYIPPSLQTTRSQSINKKNNDLFVELEQRLSKERNSYLLFADHLSESIEKELELKENESSKAETTSKANQSNKKQKIKKAKRYSVEEPKIDPQIEEKARRVREEIITNKRKPTSGLQRSLSKIMEEDQEVLKSKQNNLNSLFSEEKRN